MSSTCENYATVDPKQLHKSRMTFWRQAQSKDTASQTSWKTRWATKVETSWAGKQAKKAETASQTSWETRPETKKDKTTEADTASQHGDKLADSDKMKTSDKGLFFFGPLSSVDHHLEKGRAFLWCGDFCWRDSGRYCLRVFF